MLKVKTQAEWREEFCDLLESGKYRRVGHYTTDRRRELTRYYASNRCGELMGCALQIWHHYLTGEWGDTISVYKLAAETIGGAYHEIWKMNDKGDSTNHICRYVRSYNDNTF